MDAVIGDWSLRPHPRSLQNPAEHALPDAVAPSRRAEERKGFQPLVSAPHLLHTAVEKPHVVTLGTTVADRKRILQVAQRWY